MICPRCKADLEESPAAYGCSRWREGCEFKVWKDALKRFGGKKLTKTQAKQLFSKGEISVKLQRKSGEEYEKCAVLDDVYGIRIDFDR